MKQESETKQKLLDTTLDLIWEHSYGSVSVDDICKRAGVLKGSFYHFFHSKSDLAAATLESYWDQFRRPQLDQIFSPQVAPLERLTQYCDQLYQNQKDRFSKTGRVCGCPINSMGSELSSEDEKVRKKSQEISARVRTYLESALRDAEHQGLWQGRNIPSKAMELYSHVTGTLLQARINNNLEMIKGVKPAMLRLLGLEVELTK
jgi:TetR/AcrR family transcriptional repressor of nem operon